MSLRLAWPLLALTLLSGCSRLSLAWNLAPWYLEKKAAVFLDVPERDRDAFGRDVEALLERWAREQGPALAGLAHELALAVEEGDQDKALKGLFEALPAQWDALAEPALAPGAAWLVRKDAQGLQDLEAAFARIAQEEAAKQAQASSPGQRTKRLRGNLEDWLGSLSPEQERRLPGWSDSMAFPREQAYADRRRRRARLLETLRAGKGQAAVEAQLRLWWIAPEKDREPAYAKAMAAYNLELRRVSGELLASLDPAQRSHLSARLNGYGHELAKIAAKHGALIAELPGK